MKIPAKKISDEQITEYLPLVKKIALKMRSRLPASVHIDDLISAGMIGLVQALDKFQEERGFQFKTFAEFRIRGAMVDELRSADWAPKGIRQQSKQYKQACEEIQQEKGRPATDGELAKVLCISTKRVKNLAVHTQTLDNMNASEYKSKDKELQPLKEVENVAEADQNTDPFRQAALANMRQVLSARLRELDPMDAKVLELYYFAELNLKEIGAKLEICESRVSQIHSRALKKLRAHLQHAKLDEEALAA
jgi:RNA polymerase sigma factor for flagellar operon FliA